MRKDDEVYLFILSLPSPRNAGDEDGLRAKWAIYRLDENHIHKEEAIDATKIHAKM